MSDMHASSAVNGEVLARIPHFAWARPSSRPHVAKAPQGTDGQRLAAVDAALRLRRRAYASVAAAGGTAFAACALIVRSGRVSALETRVFRAINDLPSSWYPVANVIQQAGNLFAALAVAAAALALRRRRLAGCVLLATAAKLGIERVIKALVVRERPGTTVPGAILRGNVPVHGQSFVSGHAIVITMLAVILFSVLPRRGRLALVGLAAAVMVVRVYIGAHNPLDVVGGMTVGLLIGGLCCLTVDPLVRRTRGLGRKASTVEPTVASGGSAPNGWGRHPGDILRVCCASVIVGVTSQIAATHKVGSLEEDIFRLINRLPEALHSTLNTIMQAGALAAVPVVAVGALTFRRVRMARDVAIAGGSAWLLAKVLKSIVGRQRPFAVLGAVFRHTTDTGLGFPSGHAAVAAAIAGAAAPYLSRRTRRCMWGVVVVVGIARIYVGGHLPLDVIGGWALGWLLGSIVHLVLGAPNTGPSTGQVEAAVESIVGDTTDVQRLETDARGSVPFVASTPGGEVFAKVITRQNRDADALYKVARLILFRHLEDEAPFTSPQHVAEHEAYVTMMAERAGARVAHVRGSARFAHSSVLVSDRIDGATSLDQLADDADVSALLTDTWRQIGLLHQAHIAHRDLRLANVIVGSDGLVRIIDFGFAEETASQRRMAMDIAEFLVSAALRFGTDRAVSSALAWLGAAQLATAMPFIQPLALSASTRAHLRLNHHTLHELRAAVAAETGTPEPHLEPLARIKPLTIVMIVALGFGIHLLLPQIGDLGATIRSVRTARWPWLAGALLSSALTYVFAAVAVLGASPIRLLLGRTTVAELASSFANRFVPLGGIGVMVRYLQRHGLDVTTAGTTIATVDLAGFTVHLPLLLLAGYATGTSGFKGVSLPTGWHVLLVAVGVLVVIGIVLATPLRHRIRASLVQALHQLGGVVRDPRREAELWLGSLGITTMYIAAFACSLAAFSAHVPIEHLAFVFLLGTAVAAAAPTPGGLGAVEAALVAGLTATGVAAAPAIAGVLAFRLATFWLPTLPGWVAFRTLRHHEEL